MNPEASGQAVSTRWLAVTRTVAVLITIGIGLASFVLSFNALEDLATRAGIPERLAWLWPLIVDGTILQATMSIIALSGRAGQDGNRRYFWVVLSASAAVSVIGNAWHAVLPSASPLSPWLAAAIAVVAPVSLLAATHGLSLLIGIATPRVGAARWALDDRAAAAPVRLQRPREETGAEPAAPADLEESAVGPVAPMTSDALEPWEGVADVIASRAPERELDADTVAAVLHLSYERELSPKAIARELGLAAEPVRDVVAESAELLRSGELSVERVAV